MEVKKISTYKSAEKTAKENEKFFARLRKKKPAQLDTLVHTLHEEVFAHTDCLACGNCCKTISPMLTDRDIEKLAKHLKLKPSLFTEKYLHIDSDNQYVFNETPCPFLMTDNYCLVYAQRPKACAEYPHTDRKKFYQLLDITLNNTFVCPAVNEIVEKMKTKLHSI
ncbi:MAG: zinc/iron-chelating domain-containing protein [Bacteroidetes bacterium CG2_30_32_10]|nr:MAG: zinc/iron-chelating domain-containing protein [Bacteroidetes bacterium CG2_30_32_10]